MTATIRQATPGVSTSAANTLAIAFEDYPWTRWSIPAENYPVRLESLQALYCQHALDHGLLLVDESGRGAAAALPPHAPEPAETMQSQVAELHGDRLGALFSTELPPSPPGAWEFATLGVRPTARGAGLGSALIDAALTLIDERDPGNTVALETSDLRNVRLYERHGFSVTATPAIIDGPTVYSMRRG